MGTKQETLSSRTHGLDSFLHRGGEQGEQSNRTSMSMDYQDKGRSEKETTPPGESGKEVGFDFKYNSKLGGF